MSGIEKESQGYLTLDHIEVEGISIPTTSTHYLKFYL